MGFWWFVAAVQFLALALVVVVMLDSRRLRSRADLAEKESRLYLTYWTDASERLQRFQLDKIIADPSTPAVIRHELEENFRRSREARADAGLRLQDVVGDPLTKD